MFRVIQQHVRLVYPTPQHLTMTVTTHQRGNEWNTGSQDRLPEEEEDKVFKNNVNQSVRMFMEGPTIRGRLERGVAAYTVSTICRAQGKMGKH